MIQDPRRARGRQEDVSVEEVSSDLFDPVRQTGDGHISTIWCDTRKEEEPMNQQQHHLRTPQSEQEVLR